MVLVLLLIVLI